MAVKEKQEEIIEPVKIRNRKKIEKIEKVKVNVKEEDLVDLSPTKYFYYWNNRNIMFAHLFFIFLVCISPFIILKYRT